MQPTRIKLMADYDCSPLWWAGDGKVSPIELDEIPLSENTIERLKLWATAYNRKLNREDPANSPGFTSEEQSAFECEGVSLLDRLQRELAPNYEVVYFSETLRKVINMAEINSMKVFIEMLFN